MLCAQLCKGSARCCGVDGLRGRECVPCRGRSGLPKEFLHACQVVEVAREDEEVVAEAVEVAEHEVVDFLLCVEAEYHSFGAAADGAGQVGVGAEGGAAGQHEGAGRRGGGVESVDPALALGDVGLGEAEEPGGGLGRGVGGQVGAYVEQDVLYVPQVGAYVGGAVWLAEDDAEGG